MTLMEDQKYTTALIKGSGAVAETMVMLSAYNGQDKKHFLRMVLDCNMLSTSSERRARDLVERVFYRRYVRQDGNAALNLKKIRDKGLPLRQFQQLLYLYTVRSDKVLYDFITQQMAPAITKGIKVMDDTLPKSFVDGINETGNLQWSDLSRVRVACGIHRTLADFGIISNNGTFTFDGIAGFTFTYLFHELHFRGLTDKEVWMHPDWEIFFLDRYKVLELIKEHSLTDGYIAQSSGDFLSVTWKYKNMEEMIDGTI